VAVGAIRLGGADMSAYVLYAAGCANRTLAVDESCDISAFFRPQTAGPKTAAISIAATSQPTRTVDLTGAAT
jgi:hypothetical protein